MGDRKLEAKLQRLTSVAIEETQQEVAFAVSVKFGSPTQRLIGELGLYARHLRTWTCDDEQFESVRPLRELLADAAITLQIQANLAEQDAALTAMKEDDRGEGMVDE